MNAVSLQMGVMNLTMILGPAIAGLLISPLGVEWAFLLSSALFLVATVLETRLPNHGMVGAHSTRSLWQEAREGFSYIAGDPVLRVLLLANTLLIMFAFPVQQTLPVFAKDVFDKGPAGLGTLVAMTGVGGLLGSMVAAHLDHYAWKGRALFAGSATMGALYAAFALAPSFALALPLLALGAFGEMFSMTVNNTVVLSMVGHEMRGRVMAIMPMAIGLTPLAVFPVSVAADEVGALNRSRRNQRLDDRPSCPDVCFCSRSAAVAELMRWDTRTSLQAARLLDEGAFEFEADRLSGQEPVTSSTQ